MASIERIRRVAVAGSFYPREPKTLRGEVDAMLASADSVHSSGQPVVLIEPHAGYMYSGQVAAHGYRLLLDRSYDTVVLVGPSHVEYFPFASVFDGDAYETPLGPVPVDRNAATGITSGRKLVKMSDHGHMQTDLPRREHGLEVQLPFLQRVLDDFRIVPIVMGDQRWEVCSELGEALAPLLERPNTVIVVSSDLSHFHGYDDAKRLDGQFCRTLAKVDPQELFHQIRDGHCEACGAGPVVAALIACQRAGATNCQVLCTANSGDVTGDRSSVVGYAAAAVFAGRASDDTQAVESDLSPECRDYLLGRARRAIARELGFDAPEPLRPDARILDEARGVFVTLKRKGRLRGCIGTVEPQSPLVETVANMAKAAAVGDPRFSPITGEDLDGLAIEISVLSPLRRIDDVGDIIVGTHGLVVERGAVRGLLLPQVAVEHKWGRQAFLENTCEKALLPPDAWQHADVSVFTFTASVFAESPA